MVSRKKPATPAKKAAAKPVKVAPAAPAAKDAEAEAKVRAPSLRLKALVDQVAAETGSKAKPAKAMVEATLRAIGDALGRGEELNLPGFGRARIARSAERDGASHLTLKVRRGPHKKRGSDDTEPLAEDGEDS